MATELFSNLASTTVTAGGTTAPAAGTVETWTVASSASFPAAVAGTSQFRVQEDDATRQSEVVLVTDVAGTSWTVTRGVEGTTPVAHPAGFTVVQTITKGVLNALLQVLPGAYPPGVAEFGQAGGAGTGLPGSFGTTNIAGQSLNQRFRSGLYNGDNTTNGPAALGSSWIFLEVFTHIFTADWQRQIVWDMTGGADRAYTRRCEGGDATMAPAWTAWVQFAPASGGGGDGEILSLMGAY